MRIGISASVKSVSAKSKSTVVSPPTRVSVFGPVPNGVPAVVSVTTSPATPVSVNVTLTLRLSSSASLIVLSADPD